MIDVLFVGSDGDKDAIAFMNQLAAAGGGECVVRNIGKSDLAIGNVVRGMLGLPAPVAL